MHSLFSRFLLAAVVLGLYTVQLDAGDKKGQCPASDIKGLLKGITHLTDDDVRFSAKNGVNIFIDPVSGPNDSLVLNSGKIRPDLILITHSHGDHFQPAVLQEYIKLNPQVVLAGPADAVITAQEKGISQMMKVIPGEKYTLAGIHIKTVPAYFSNGDSHPKSNQWVGYVLWLNGKSYYITGDTEPVPEMADLKVDVLFPLLFGCGGNMDFALKMAELTKAHLVVPVHTDNNKEVIEKYISKLPAGVSAVYFQKGKLIAGKELKATM